MCAGDQTGKALPLRPISEKTRRILQSDRLRTKHNLNKKLGSDTKYKQDALTVMVAYTKFSLEKTSEIINHVQKKIGLNTTTYLIPNIILAASIATILSVLLPKILLPSTQAATGFWKFLYIVTMAIHFGTMTWMSFVSGVVLYFSLRRHIFGQVQQHLFPAYYVHNSINAFINVISFIKIQPTFEWKSSATNQLILLLVIFFIELSTRLYISHHIVRLKHLKTQIETEAGSGQEVGEQVLGELVNCPHYMKILRSFRKFHSITVVGNLTVVMCSLIHVNYLANKLCL